jgi:hypothetical protein
MSFSLIRQTSGWFLAFSGLSAAGEAFSPTWCDF